ncbi:universal stress protein [Halocatena salina]|uniref:Universal stress protein n=1 Tax=Halocatena salina TaxID=2934340 RepID=A0A8U0A774_9EURY|nr:universal stress protein [Halocatena salina]UPM45030.1 universal stress protein [Halocatena salina]
MFDRILIPTDGSDAVRPAVETAINLAEIHDAILHVLYIVNQPTIVSGTGEGVPGLDNLLAALEKTGHETTTVVADQATDQEIDVQTAVQRGNPHDDILTYATEHDIDLIVMGTHGRTGVKRALLGSVTETVVRHAENPVLTVHREPKT